MRLDLYLVGEHDIPSREKARALIMSGCVYINNQKADKAGTEVREKDVVELRLPEKSFVSRGGNKLLKAIEESLGSLEGLCVMDIGASTGGFTDCALQHGAEFVYAIDVGYGQLAWELRNDARVCNLERTNIRKLSPELVEKPVELFTIDVSFISLKLIFPLLEQFAKKDFRVVALIKPQFEAGREKVGKNGVVKDIATHKEVILNVLDYAAQNGLHTVHLTYSPIKGPKGNIEYLAVLSTLDTGYEPNVEEVTRLSHEQLRKSDA